MRLQSAPLRPHVSSFLSGPVRGYRQVHVPSQIITWAQRPGRKRSETQWKATPSSDSGLPYTGNAKKYNYTFGNNRPRTYSTLPHRPVKKVRLFSDSTESLPRDAYVSKCHDAEKVARAAMGGDVLSGFRSVRVARTLLSDAHFQNNNRGKQLPLFNDWFLGSHLQLPESCDHTTVDSSFSLRVNLPWSSRICKVGPYNRPSFAPEIEAELHLQPKSSQMSLFTDVCPNQSFANTDVARNWLPLQVEHIALAFRKAIGGRSFGSPSLFIETAAVHIESAFNQSQLSQYLDLKRTNVYLRGMGALPAAKEYAGEEISLRDHQNPEGAEVYTIDSDNQKAIGYSTLGISLTNGSTISASTSRMLAQAIESNCAKSGLAGLASIIDGVCGAVGDLPSHVASTVVFEDPVSSVGPSSVYGDDREASQTRLTTHSVELETDNSSGPTGVAIKSIFQKKLSAKLRGSRRSSYGIEVTGIVLKMAAVNTLKLAASSEYVATRHITAGEETTGLVQRSCAVLDRICAEVDFDDFTSVPDMLAEAILRVVSPLTPSLQIEEVSLLFRQDSDEAVELERRVSAKGLVTSTQPPGEIDIPAMPNGDTVLPRATTLLMAEHALTPISPELAQAMGRHRMWWNASLDLTSINDFPMALTEVQPRIVGLSSASDFFSLVDLSRAISNSLPYANKLTIHVQRASEHDGHEPYGARLNIHSDGTIRIASSKFELPIGLESLNQGGVDDYRVTWSLEGSPSPSSSDGISAILRADRLHGAISAEIRKNLAQRVFKDGKHFSEEVADLIDGMKGELADVLEFRSASVVLGNPRKSMKMKSIKMKMNQDQDGLFVLEQGLGTAPYAEIIHSGGKTIGNRQHSFLEESQELQTSDSATTLKDIMRGLDDQLAATTTKPSGVEEQADTGLQAVGPSFKSKATQSNSAAALEDLIQDLDSTAAKTRPMKRGVVVALGSNVGSRIEEIEKACRAIDEDPDMRIVDTSCLYETEPMYVEDQERFVNGACEIETSLTPLELLDRLQAIEQGHGRVKLIDKGPRNIDLDIAIFRDQIVESDRLTIPHLLMHEREFVIRPIMDLWNMRTWRNPRTKTSLFGEGAKNFPWPISKIDTITPLTETTSINASFKGRRTHVMSILNTTPDSFSDGGSNALDAQSLRSTAAAHIAAGATIIDIGGQSSRPGAPDISAEEEIARVLPAIAAVKSLTGSEGIAISVDTYRAAVAEAAVNAGAHIVNDISAGMLDPQMLSTVAKLGCTYIMMHMRGTPHTMQNPENCRYGGRLFSTINSELDERVQAAIAAGIRRWRIIKDRGVGFAKTQSQNLALLSKGERLNRERVSTFMPHLVGSSRKGFIGKITGVEEPKDRVWGTAATVTAAISSGADIVRVHDVKEMVQVAKMADAIYRSCYDRKKDC
ncbi:hypothetical protein Q7P37_009536 [Cladosporium fusiforme]